MLNSKYSTTSIYQIFVRNYSREGNFQAIIDDLARIKNMGFTYIYLCPIHPIGEKMRKGSLGSPYSIKDYYAINEEHGTMEDFEHLIAACHKIGLKVMMDLVLNHTARDHYYTKEHPEYYYRNKNQEFANRIGDWTDIIDLDYQDENLIAEISKMLCFYAQKKIDGFRCDVASLVPLHVWQKLKVAVNKINPQMFWLAESVDIHFIEYVRSMNFAICTDAELATVFDALYSYDVKSYFNRLVKDDAVIDYCRMINYQTNSLPFNTLKVQCLENHDRPRIHALIEDPLKIKNLLAYSFLSKGIPFVYAGQEFKAKHTPSLFEKDVIDRTNAVNDQDYLKMLNYWKKSAIFKEMNYYHLDEYDNIISIKYASNDEEYRGIFNILQVSGKISLDLADGQYTNLLDGTTITVLAGETTILKQPVFIKTKGKGEKK